MKGPSHIYTLYPFSPLPSRLAHDIEQSSMCYRIGLCWLSIFSIAGVCDLASFFKAWFVYHHIVVIVLYIVQLQVSYLKYVLWIFSLSVVCCFIFLTKSLEEQTFKFWWSMICWYTFFFMVHGFCILSKNLFPTSRFFSFISFCKSYSFRLVTQFELIFMYPVS